MSHNKGPADKGTLNPRLDKDAKELERESRHQAEGAERRDVTDDEAGVDRILEKVLPRRLVDGDLDRLVDGHQPG